MNRVGVNFLNFCSHHKLKSPIKTSLRPLYVTATRFKDDSNDGDSKDDAKEKAQQKLNSLLQDLQVSGALNIKSDIDSKLAKPNRSKPHKRTSDGKYKSPLPNTDELDDDLVNATKDVASLSKRTMKTESDLLRRLKKVTKETNVAKEENEVSGETLGSIFGSIKVERPLSKTKKEQYEKTKEAGERQNLTMEQLAFLQKRAKLRRANNAAKQPPPSVDLRGGNCLGIFTEPLSEAAADSAPAGGLLTKWRACQERELLLLSTPPPRNAIEEMIVQTNQGKLWHFPVNNEQGDHSISNIFLDVLTDVKFCFPSHCHVDFQEPGEQAFSFHQKHVNFEMQYQ